MTYNEIHQNASNGKYESTLKTLPFPRCPRTGANLEVRLAKYALCEAEAQSSFDAFDEDQRRLKAMLRNDLTIAAGLENHPDKHKIFYAAWLNAILIWQAGGKQGTADAMLVRCYINTVCLLNPAVGRVIPQGEVPYFI
jgi:hypothetical protein